MPKPARTEPLPREALEALDKRIANLGASGAQEDDYIGRLGRLITKYKIKLPSVQVIVCVGGGVHGPMHA